MTKITISGNPGAGKTTLGKIIAKQLGLKFYSIGDLMGKLAIQKGISIEQLNILEENESLTDQEVDNFQKEFGKRENDFVIDGRLSWYFIPDSIKIFLDVKKEIGAKRIFNTKRKDEAKGTDWKDQMQKIEERIASDKRRYMKYYGVNFENRYNYNIILDTSHITIDEASEILIDKIREIEKNVEKN